MAIRKRLQVTAAPAPKKKPEALKRSTLEVMDIPLDRLIPSPENPNEQDDTTFDELVEALRKDGCDEPIIVVPQKVDGRDTGKYYIASGEHRYKGAKFLGWKTIPGIVKPGWSDDERKIALVRRNMLRGALNPEKFTKLYGELAKKYDKELLKRLMGFTKTDAFEKVYKAIESSVTPKQRKQLAEAKETIKSVDDLSSVLNTIFKEHGSELDFGFMVFSFGGKNHHYFKTDAELDKLLKKLEATLQSQGMDATEFFKGALRGLDLNVAVKSATVPSSPKKKGLRKVSK
jgi:hypothetical protein